MLVPNVTSESSFVIDSLVDTIDALVDDLLILRRRRRIDGRFSNHRRLFILR